MGKIKTAVYICVFILVWVPLVLPLIPGYTQSIKTEDFSIYNPFWNGCFLFKMELSRKGYDVRPLISSLSVLSRAENATLVILGPSSATINPIEITELAAFVRDGGSILIADDFGTGNMFTALLFWTLGLQPPFFWKYPLYGSYKGSLTTWTITPTVTTFNVSHPIFQGVHQIILNAPTALANVPPESQTATLTLGILDVDGDMQLEPFMPDIMLPNAVIVAVYDLSKMSIEVDGQEINYGKGKIVLVSDPSIFNNDMIMRGDNLKFASNLIDWLSGKNDGGSNLVIFDEAHLATPFYSYDKLFGSIMGYIDWASANWLLAPIYPILIVFSIWRWLPRRKPEELGPTPVYLKRGKTFLTERLEWYKENKQYGYAVKLLYRRMKRYILRYLKLKEFDVETVAKMLAKRIPDMKRKEIKRFLETCEVIDRGEKPVFISSDAFLNYFFRMKKIMEGVVSGK